MITLLKILSVIIIMLSMILVLLFIGFLANPADSTTKEDSDRLLHDLETRDRVITSDSIFHKFLARPQRHPGK